jgi:hypothetical protein
MKKKPLATTSETPARLDTARTFDRRSALLGGAALSASALGCSQAIEGESESQLGADSDALQDGNPSTLTLVSGYSPVSPPPGTAPTGSPALCAPSTHMFVIFQQGGPSGAYWATASAAPEGSIWQGYGTFAFSSPPALAPLPKLILGADQHEELRFLAAGRRSSDGKIYWSEGTVLRSASYPPFNPPAPVTTFTKLNDNVFSGSYGFPALGASTAGDAILSYVGLDSANVPQVYVNPKPYGGSWKARVTAPLPTGWTPIGTPAVTWGWQNLFTIVVTGKNSSNQYALFRAFFNGTDFANPYSTDPKKFSPITLYPGSVSCQNSPAVEWDSELDTHTVYYRFADDFYEFSFYYDTAIEKSRLIVGGRGNRPAFVASPSVQGGKNFENGRHWILGRDRTNSLWIGFTDTDGVVVP